jgi:hypothetical protein
LLEIEDGIKIEGRDGRFDLHLRISLDRGNHSNGGFDVKLNTSLGFNHGIFLDRHAFPSRNLRTVGQSNRSGTIAHLFNNFGVTGGYARGE